MKFTKNINSIHNTTVKTHGQLQLARKNKPLFALFIFTICTIFAGFVHAIKVQAADAPAVNRTPLLPRTLVFSRTQSQYNLYFNYLHHYTPEWYWIDRPLFFDRSLAPKEFAGSNLTEPSFSRIIDSARPYEIDGFSALSTASSNTRNYLQALDYAGKKPGDPFSIVLEVSALGKDVEEATKKVGQTLEKALASKAAQRVNGKVLISSYNLDSDSPRVVAQVVKNLREKYGDTFVLVAAIGKDWWPAYNNSQDGISPNKALTELQAKLRAWLDACDGIMYVMIGDAANLNNDGRLDEGYYSFVIRTCQGVLSEPSYHNKYFGLGSSIGYFNPVTNVRANEDGTKYLRNSLHLALDAHPDFLILPEWDEANENTSIQPTVYNSRSTERILRYAMRQLKKQPQTPLPGDDVSIPNLVISYRQFLMLGERLQVEILNVPDGSATGDYTLKLSLKDIDHKVVKKLPPAKLSAVALKDFTFEIPSEELAEYPVLMPSLEVTTPDGRTQTFDQGLACIRLYATMNWNYKWVKMPLRDLLQPQDANFKLSQPQYNSGEPVAVEGKVKANENIMSAEVVADGLELFALDPSHTYDLKPDEALVIIHEHAPERLSNFKGKYYVTGGTVRRINEQFGFWGTRQSGEIADDLTWSPLGQIFVVTNKDTAVIHIENNIYKTSIPVAQLLKDKVYSEVHDRAVTLMMRVFQGVPEMPLPLRTKEASFATTINPVRPDTALQMRVITESGKIYRSWPVLLRSVPTGNSSLPVYSEARKESVAVKVDSSRLPQISASPTDTAGASIHDSNDPYFYGTVGGTPYWSYVVRKKGSYPADARQTAPARVKEDGIDCWKFDGKGNFLYFPAETLPRGAFTLSFRFKPLSAKRQIILANRGHLNGAFTLTMEDGKLGGYYSEGLSRREPYYPQIALEPEVAVPLGKWSKVEIIYDLKQIVFKVDGQVSKAIPLSVKGRISTPLLFGGYGEGKQDGYFEGYLQELNINHGVTKR